MRKSVSLFLFREVGEEKGDMLKEFRIIGYVKIRHI
ncbi:hypothetical protein EP10_001605 [Geobacillus icigianus]|uniref:Uncharacterized protein n=1 Tax=Geobacillus icigianus TaxID=1430331 RepID=A0ABU6BGF3_9BACL|nr:hypothetical protein [Geobacillus icigianus]